MVDYPDEVTQAGSPSLVNALKLIYVVGGLPAVKRYLQNIEERKVIQELEKEFTDT